MGAGKVQILRELALKEYNFAPQCKRAFKHISMSKDVVETCGNFSRKSVLSFGNPFPSNLEIFDAVKALQRLDKIISVNECIFIMELS